MAPYFEQKNETEAHNCRDYALFMSTIKFIEQFNF